MTKFYNLPPPWDPGLAIPNSVLEEGLERHAYVTRWAPRGTYNPETGGNPAGYAIPRYVMEEGTGRGTFTTAWTPRGYYGPRLPHYLNRQPVPNIVLGDASFHQTIPSTTPNVPPPPNWLSGIVASNICVSTPDKPCRVKGDGRPRQPVAVPIDPNTGLPVGVAPPPPPASAMMSRILPLALLGGAAFIAYRFIKGRSEKP